MNSSMGSSAGGTGQAIAIKVPEVTLGFWIIKIAATMLAETGGDAVTLSMGLGYLLGSAVFAVAFTIAVIAQMAARDLRPAVYWLAMVTAATLGATFSDFVDRSLALGYPGGSVVLCGLLLGALTLWQRLQGTISISSISSPSSELLYWITVLCAQTLGTILGDWVADTMLGIAGSALFFGGLVAMVAAAYFWTRISRTLLFWVAFVLTGPLGGAAGDYLDQPVDSGGLGLSRYAVSASLILIMALCIGLFSRRASRRRAVA